MAQNYSIEAINREIKKFIEKVKGVDITKPEEVKALQDYCLEVCGEGIDIEDIKKVQAGKCDNLEVTSVIYLTPQNQEQMKEQFDDKENQQLLGKN